jgi:hypothetical protein
VYEVKGGAYMIEHTLGVYYVPGCAASALQCFASPSGDAYQSSGSRRSSSRPESPQAGELRLEPVSTGASWLRIAVVRDISSESLDECMRTAYSDALGAVMAVNSANAYTRIAVKVRI